MHEVDQYTVSLLHFDDSLKDECGNLWSGSDTVQYSSDVKEDGTKSIYFKNDKAKISPNEYSKFSCLSTSGTFSIDFWVYVQEVNDQVVLGMKFNDTIYNMLEVGITHNNTLEIGTNYPPSGDWVFHNTTNIIQMNYWNYIYVAITPNAIYAAINGKVEKFSNNLVKYNEITELSVGNRCKDVPDGHTFKGYIDEFRISNIARWITDFDPRPNLKALLVVTMSDETQKEYELSKEQINDFITWYDNRSTGTGLPHYTFNKDFNLGPFQSRKDYLVFDKIQNFEVMEYTK